MYISAIDLPLLLTQRYPCNLGIRYSRCNCILQHIVQPIKNGYNINGVVLYITRLDLFYLVANEYDIASLTCVEDGNVNSPSFFTIVSMLYNVKKVSKER